MNAAKRIFHWQYSGTSIFGLYTVGFAAWGLAVSTDPVEPLFKAAAVFMLFGFLWSQGWLWTREFAGKRSNLLRAIALSLFLCIPFGWFGTLLSKSRNARLLGMMTGSLEPSNEPDPPHSCPLVNSELGVVVGNRIGFKAHRLPLAILSVMNVPAIIIDRDARGYIVVSVTVRSVDGRVIAMLDKNHFIVNQNNILSMSRPDMSTLLVRDQDGDEVLETRFNNKHTISLSGKFHTSGRVIDLSQLPIRGGCIDILHGPEGAGGINVN
jgi:hypothetical protein